MKYIITFCALFIIFISSCDPIQQTTKTTNQNYSKFDLFVKRFKSRNPKMWDNDLTKGEGNEKFKRDAKKYFNDSLGLATMPLYVSSINKNINGKGYIVHWQNDNSYQENDISEFSHIDVFALTDIKIAKSLIQKESEKYFISK
jgi:hypothetical protein